LVVKNSKSVAVREFIL